MATVNSLLAELLQIPLRTYYVGDTEFAIKGSGGNESLWGGLEESNTKATLRWCVVPVPPLHMDQAPFPLGRSSPSVTAAAPRAGAMRVAILLAVDCPGVSPETLAFRSPLPRPRGESEKTLAVSGPNSCCLTKFRQAQSLNCDPWTNSVFHLVLPREGVGLCGWPQRAMPALCKPTL